MSSVKASATKAGLTRSRDSLSAISDKAAGSALPDFRIERQSVQNAFNV
jgi:hypothetical protein